MLCFHTHSAQLLSPMIYADRETAGREGVQCRLAVLGHSVNRDHVGGPDVMT